MTIYMCGICDTNPHQKSHHNSHINTKKHLNNKDLFEQNLKKKDSKILLEKYKTLNIKDIIKEQETKIIEELNIYQNNKAIKISSTNKC